ncbi:MAG: hypothetical protein WBI41_05775 [Azovibrio sp.]|uniref:ATP-dependent DNA ligase n=1 Tax=Azovibrio sp. TaxID=1872673 RepID=UPI003C7292E9
MTKPFRVMLATDYEPEKLRFPVLASPKLDGIRAYVKDGVILSRQNKPIPNAHVQSLFSKYEHYDGELIVGSPTDPMCYRNTLSGVMSEDGEPDVTFYVFDHLGNTLAPYYLRNPAAGKVRGEHVKLLTQEHVGDHSILKHIEARYLELGYEGVILRKPDAPYKQGRSTVREGYLLKVKTFLDDEAVVVGFEERMHNTNEATVSETGHTKRSSHQAGKVGRGDLGALVVEWKDMRFNIGTGFTDAERADIWAKRNALVGQLIKFKYFPVGGYEAPRHPVFAGFRDRRDV